MKITEKQIRFWLSPKERLFGIFDRYVLQKENSEKHRIFVDRGSDVLFVAHLDTVQRPKFKRITDKIIYASGLDDRLGCMLAYELSEKLGADLLLTDHEESFGSTAQYHDCKDYNWIAEFDRAGTDVVTYGLDSDVFLAALCEYWDIGYGSYSDIYSLDTESCCVNVGIGYQLPHNTKSYTKLKDLHSQMEKFEQFYQQYKDTKFERAYQSKYVYDNYNYDFVCCVCNCITASEEIYGHPICEGCLNEMLAQFCWQESTRY